MLRQGEGRIIITASSEDKMQKVRLPILESEESAWEFFEILFEELRCEPFYEKDPETSTKSIKNDVDKHSLSSSSTTTTLTFSASAAGFSPPQRVNKEESVSACVFFIAIEKPL